jgi:hypothetical protein
MDQPRPDRARAAPAAHSCLWGASLPPAATAPTGPPASRSPGGRGRRQPHTRPARTHRLPSPTNETRGARRPTRQPRASAAPAVAVLAGDNDAPRRRECAAGAARALPGCGWQVVLSVRWRRVATMRPDDTTVRLAPPSPSRAAAGSGSWRHGGGVGKRRANAMRLCGWRRPRPPGLRWQVVRPASSASVSARYHKLRAPSPVASHDAQVREGPGAAKRSAWSSWVHPCAALGPDAASCSRGTVLCAHVCSDGRARSLTTVCTRGLHGACGPTTRLAWSQRPDERLPREKGRQSPFSLGRGAGAAPRWGGRGQSPRRTTRGQAPTPPSPEAPKPRLTPSPRCPQRQSRTPLPSRPRPR